MWGYVGQSEGLQFYSEENRELLEMFRQGDDMLG